MIFLYYLILISDRLFIVKIIFLCYLVLIIDR